MINNFSRNNWATAERNEGVVICILFYPAISLVDAYRKKIIMKVHKHLTTRKFTVVYRVIYNCEKLEKA